MVERGMEDQFIALKRHFTAFIQECIIDKPCGKAKLVKINIVPLPGADLVRQWADTKDIEFDW